jgi:S1-C subfamily serine protease
MILTIRHLSGSLAGRSQRVALQEGQVLRLGRGEECDIKLGEADDSVSGQHAELSLQGGRLFLEDKRSSNGTFLNGAPCPPFQKVAVPDGSRIRLAQQGPEMQMTAEPAAARAGATGAAAPPKESVGRATLLREIDRARQEERDVVAGEVTKARKNASLWGGLGLLLVLLLAGGGIGGAMWWSRVEKERLAEELERQKNVWTDVEQRVSPAVVHIRCVYRIRVAGLGEFAFPGVEGSGVQIRPGLILTALHVVEPWKFIFQKWGEMEAGRIKAEYDLLDVQFPGQQPIKATLVSGSPENDLALLQIQQTTAPVVGIGKSNADVRVTDEIAILGYPGGLGQYAVAVRNASGAGEEVMNVTEVVPTFIKGTVTQPLTGTGDSSHYLFFDASIEPGNSGGPVVDKEGNLIGIVSLQFERQGKPVNIFGESYPTWVPMDAGSVAVTPDDIQAFLHKHGIL